MKRVFVRFLDPRGWAGGWTPIDECAEHTSALCEASGTVLREDDEEIVLAQCVSLCDDEPNDADHVLAIPVAAIVATFELPEAWPDSRPYSDED